MRATSKRPARDREDETIADHEVTTRGEQHVATDGRAWSATKQRFESSARCAATVEDLGGSPEALRIVDGCSADRVVADEDDEA